MSNIERLTERNLNGLWGGHIFNLCSFEVLRQFWDILRYPCSWDSKIGDKSWWDNVTNKSKKLKQPHKDLSECQMCKKLSQYLFNELEDKNETWAWINKFEIYVETRLLIVSKGGAQYWQNNNFLWSKVFAKRLPSYLISQSWLQVQKLQLKLSPGCIVLINFIRMQDWAGPTNILGLSFTYFYDNFQLDHLQFGIHSTQLPNLVSVGLMGRQRVYDTCSVIGWHGTNDMRAEGHDGDHTGWSPHCVGCLNDRLWCLQTVIAVSSLLTRVSLLLLMSSTPNKTCLRQFKSKQKPVSGRLESLGNMANVWCMLFMWFCWSISINTYKDWISN